MRRHLLLLAWLLPLVLAAQSPPPRKARPAPTGLKVLSAILDPNPNPLHPSSRIVTVLVQNTTDKTVVAHVLVLHEFSQNGTELNAGGAGMGIDWAEPDSRSDNTRHYILPGQIATIQLNANLEAANVIVNIAGLVYEDGSSEGEASKMFFITRQRQAQEAREAATKEPLGEKRMELERRAEWYENHGPKKGAEQ